MATVSGLQTLKEGEEEQQDDGGGQNWEEKGTQEEKGNQEEGEQKCRSELDGGATGVKVVAERKKNRWFEKLSFTYKCTFFTFTFDFSPIFAFSHDDFEKQVAGNSAQAFDGNFWHHCISIFEAAATKGIK